MLKNGTEKGEVCMTFVNNNGKVPYIMAAGADYVSGNMPIDEAQKLYDNGKRRASNRFPGYPICVNNKFFFAAKKTRTTKKKELDNA